MSTKDTRYSFKEFEADFPSDAACLAHLFAKRFSEGPKCPKCGRVGKYVAVVARRSYACPCGHQVYPTAGTVFHKSPTSLKTWFFAMYLMTASKNGVSAMELMRQTGVTYKCAWRMAHQIRKLMTQGTHPLSGTVEADETYIGGRRRGLRGKKGQMGRNTIQKTPVIGVVERGGEIRAEVTVGARSNDIMPLIVYNVKEGSKVYTDEWSGYNYLAKYGFAHDTIEHQIKEYARGDVHTNTIEGFWSQLKRSINGTFHHVFRKYLQAYVDEFCYWYNLRKSDLPIFASIQERLGRSA